MAPPQELPPEIQSETPPEELNIDTPSEEENKTPPQEENTTNILDGSPVEKTFVEIDKEEKP